MQHKPTIRKELATRHHYGQDIARGPYVYCAYDGDKLVCVCATAGEARRRYRDIASGIARSPDGLPPENPRVRQWNEGRTQKKG